MAEMVRSTQTTTAATATTIYDRSRGATVVVVVQLWRLIRRLYTTTTASSSSTTVSRRNSTVVRVQNYYTEVAASLVLFFVCVSIYRFYAIWSSCAVRISARKPLFLCLRLGIIGAARGLCIVGGCALLIPRCDVCCWCSPSAPHPPTMILFVEVKM